MSQSRPLRSVHRAEGWTPQTLAEHGIPAAEVVVLQARPLGGCFQLGCDLKRSCNPTRGIGVRRTTGMYASPRYRVVLKLACFMPDCGPTIYSQQKNMGGKS